MASTNPEMAMSNVVTSDAPAAENAPSITDAPASSSAPAPAPVSSKPIHSLVLDAAPILTNNPPVSTLISQAEELFTVPSVISEIRDATARARLETTLLPFLKIRTPRPTSVKAVTDFAKKTGDLEVLSRPDIQILALTYELECERNGGDWRLRSDPRQGRVNGAAPGTEKIQEAQEEAKEVVAEKEVFVDAPKPKGAWGIPVVAPNTAEKIYEESEETKNAPTEKSAAVELPESVPAEKVEEEVRKAEEALDLLTLESSVNPAAPAATDGDSAIPDEVVEDSEEDDDEGWITPSNIKKVQEKEQNIDKKTEKAPLVMQAACITADFAMQNVLLRMNLNLLSNNLGRVRTLKTWVLRCHACFGICKDMTKQFCPRCGKPTLMRTSCSTDKDGNFKVHLKKNFQYNHRGDRYSIPKAVGGSSNMRVVGGGKGGWGQELILAEDQKEYIQKMENEKRRKDRDLMDEDFLLGLEGGKRVGHGGKARVGAGRNVNSKKRR